MLDKVLIRKISGLFEDGRTQEEVHLKIFLSLTTLYAVLNTLFDFLIYKKEVASFNFSYALAFIVLSIVGHYKFFPISFITKTYEVVLVYAILVGYTISPTIEESLIFVFVFPLVVIFLNDKLFTIIAWLFFYYGAFSIINILQLSPNPLNFFALSQIVILHFFAALSIGFYIHVSRLKARLLNIKHAKLKRTTARQEKMNKTMQELNKELNKKSTTDHLTNMNNRREILNLLQKRLERVKRSGKKSALIIIDIDNFKRVNDTYGHLTGDTVLKDVANFLKSYIRAIDDAGRYGGEEFILLLDEDQIENIHLFLSRLVKDLSNNITLDSQAITISAGASIVQGDDTTDTLIARADENLYKAKANGKNRYIFNEK